MQGAGAADTNDDTSDDETGGVLLYATLQMSTAAGIEAANHTELSLSADALRLLLRESEEGQSSEVLLPVCIVLAASDASPSSDEMAPIDCTITIDAKDETAQARA